MHEVPHLGLGLATERCRQFLWRMNLQGKPLLGIEHFHKERKPFGIAHVFTKNFRATMGPKFVQRLAAHRGRKENQAYIVIKFPLVAVIVQRGLSRKIAREIWRGER